MQPIPALHIPCTAWNITFTSMICQYRCCPRLFLHNRCRTSDNSAVQVRLAAGIEHVRVYANVGGVTISDPNCNVTVGVMVWVAYFSVVFCIHNIYIRRRKQWCLSLYVISMYRTLIIQLCQGKYSFLFYGTFQWFWNKSWMFIKAAFI